MCSAAFFKVLATFDCNSVNPVSQSVQFDWMAWLAVCEALLAVCSLHSPLVSCVEDEEVSRKRNHRCRMKKPSTYRYNDDNVYIVEVI